MKRTLLKLVIGIKRLRFRENDPRRSRADAEFAAKRPGVLASQAYTCAGCSYISKVSSHLDVHHLDDDHHNNEPANLVAACHTCHPYQHVGELVRRTDVRGEGLGNVTLLASIPEVDAANMNLLQRALGVALLDEREAPFAKRIIERLAERANLVEEEFGSFRPADVAAGMATLNDAQYGARVDVVDDIRLLFNADTLKMLGQEMVKDCPALPVKVWKDAASSLQRGSDAGAEARV